MHSPSLRFPIVSFLFFLCVCVCLFSANQVLCRVSSFWIIIYFFQVLLNQDEVSESQSDTRILRAPDEREINRIKPNPSLKIQPVFVDLGFGKKSANDRQANKGKQSNKGLNKGLCLEISGRVQHDSSDLKYLQQNQFATDSNEKNWQVPSGNGGLHTEDDGECLLDL
jgi:hypothetical protein